MVKVNKENKSIILERLENLEKNNTQNVEICQDIQKARESIQNGVLEELDKYHPDVQSLINEVTRKIDKEVDVYSTEEVRKWAKIWGADKIRKTVIRNKELFVLKKLGGIKDLSFSSYLATFRSNKKITPSHAREYLALLAEDKTEAEISEKLKKMEVDIYSIEEARKWAKIWGTKKYHFQRLYICT